MEKTITLQKDTKELRCPHCGGGGLTVRSVQILHPTDDMVVTFETDPLYLREIDGGGGGGYVTLFVDCPKCSPQGDFFYLTLVNGETRAGDFVARAHWSTDEE